MRHENNPLITRILGIAAMLLALYTILFSNIPTFSAEDAERILTDLATDLSDASNSQNGEARLQYSNLEIRGFAYNKQAYITTPSITFTGQQWRSNAGFSLSTESAFLIPDPVISQRINMHLSKPINLIASSDLLAIINPLKPIIYSINHLPASMNNAVQHRIIIPADFLMQLLEPKRNIRVELLHPIEAEINLFKTQRKLRTNITSGIVRLLSPDHSWNIESADIHYDSTQRSSKVIEGNGTLTLNKLRFTRAEENSSALAVTAAFGLKEKRNISGSIDSIHLEMERGLITDGNSQISITGDMNFDIDDTPYGDIVVEINNPTEFIKSGWIAEEKQKAALALLDTLLGEKLGSHKQAIIPITRAKNGVWKIGKVLLDEDLRNQIVDIFIFNTQESHDQNTPKETNETSPQQNNAS